MQGHGALWGQEAVAWGVQRTPRPGTSRGPSRVGGCLHDPALRHTLRTPNPRRASRSATASAPYTKQNGT